MAFKIEKTNTYYAPDRESWREWLEKNHKTSDGVWLIYYKKDSGKTRVAYDAAVEEALCFGWIDSTFNPIDEHCYMQLYTPRKSKSGWSKLNKDRIEKLIAQGLMTPAGLEKIEIAKKHGTWHKLDGIESFTPPPDLEVVFANNDTYRQFFESLSNTNKKYILYFMNNAKRPETRQKRIDELIEGFKVGKLPDKFIIPKAGAKKI